MDAPQIVALATNLPFAAAVAIWLLWRIEPLFSKLIEIESAELELMRLMSARDLGADAVARVIGATKPGAS